MGGMDFWGLNGKGGGKDDWGIDAWGKGFGKEAMCKGGTDDGKDGKDGKHNETLGTCTGRIKAINSDKGFGFIEPAKGSLADAYGIKTDAYVHQSNMGNFKVGQHVSFTLYIFNGAAQ